MKRTRRLLIEFQHRQVTITVEGSTLNVQESQPDAADSLPACPSCGGRLIEIAALADGENATHVKRVHLALQQFGLHMQVSPNGQLQVCKKSLETFKEEL